MDLFACILCFVVTCVVMRELQVGMTPSMIYEVICITACSDDLGKLYDPFLIMFWPDMTSKHTSVVLGDLQIITGCHFDTEGSHAVNRRSPWKPIWRLPSSWLSFLCMFLCSSSSFSESVLPNSQDSCKAIISFLHLRQRGPLRRASDTISIVRNGHNSTACPQAGYHGQRSFSTAKVYHRAASPAST